jgi:hypothetical protein
VDPVVSSVMYLGHDDCVMDDDEDLRMMMRTLE